MLKDFFKKNKYITVSATSLNKVEEEQKPNIPTGMWIKCDECGKILYKNDVEDNLKVCPYCKHHMRLNWRERLEYTVDSESFQEFDENMKSKNPLNFEGYDKKIQKMMQNNASNEAVVTGKATIHNEEVIICIMDSFFLMGSMGSVVGEKLTRAVEKATELKLPVIIFTTSGGARMQEGILSLMQMAKVSAALAKHSEKGLLYITVLTDPTTGGVTASFAMLGDIILAEPGALVGFAGRRVIEQTIKQELPEGFQRAEFLLEKGFIDTIVQRKDLKNTLSEILSMHKEVV
jgi:acetyl-CoA carboxylase, carboxyl transferase, beta subunit